MSWRNGPHARGTRLAKPTRAPSPRHRRAPEERRLHLHREIPVTRPASNAAIHDADDELPTRHENQDDPQGSPER